jgi:hypothetical protein
MATDNIRRVTLQNTNHHLFWDYDRELVMKAIENFLGVPELNQERTNLPHLH